MALGRAPKIISEIKKYIEDLKGSYEETQMPVTDDSVSLHKLCAKLEYMLQIDMKPSARSGMFAGKKDYWDYIYQCLHKVKGLDDGIRFVRAKTEVKTSVGRGRAFIRYSLAHHQLGDSLQQCFSNQKVTSLWYNQNSLLLNPSMYSPLIDDLYDLNSLEFVLAPSGHDLDAAWPTYSHRSAGASLGMYGGWQPPSRTDSLSSLSSQPSTLESLSSPTTESRLGLGEEDRGALGIRAELEECEQMNRELRRQVGQLRKENEDMQRLAMETEERMSSVQSELERKVQQLQCSLDRASKEASDAKQDSDRSWKDWQEKLEDAERVNSELCDRLEAVNVQHASGTRMRQEAEKNHQLALIEAERALAEMKVELAGVRTELKASRDAEARKEETIKGLEGKVSAMENKNAELLTKMEGMVESKGAEVANHLQSANKVHELLDRLSDVETRNLELMGERDVLNCQVELLKDSCSGQDEIVTKVAEVEQCFEQNTECRNSQGELNMQGKDHESLPSEMRDSVSTSKNEKECLNHSLSDHVKEVDASKNAADCLEMRHELTTLKQRCSEMSKDLEQGRKELHAAGVQNEKLKARIKHTEEVCQKRQTEIDDLCKQLGESSSKFVELSQDFEKEKEKRMCLERQIEDKEGHIQKVVVKNEELSQNMNKFHDILVGSEESSSASVTSQKARGALLHCQMKKIICERDDAVKKTVDLQSENSRLQVELQTARESASNDEASAAEIEMQGLRQKLESMGRRVEDKEKSLQSQSMEMQRLEARLQALAEEKERLELDVVRLRLAVEVKDKERESIIEDRTKLEAGRDTLLMELDATRAEREATGKSLGEQAEVISQLMADVQQLKAGRAEAEETKDRVQKLLEQERSRTRELEDTVEDLKRVQEESVSLEQVYEERKTKMMQEHADRVEFLTEQFQLMKEEQERTSAERLHYQEQAENAQRELDQARETAETLDSESRAVREKNTDLNEEIVRLQEELDLARTERTEITVQLEQVSTETSHSLQESRTETERLQGMIATATQETEEQSARAQTLEVELLEERGRREEAERRTVEAQEEVQSTRGLMEEEVTALRYQQSSDAMQYQQTLQRVEAQEAELQQLKCRLEEQEQSQEQLQEQVSSLTQERAGLERRLSEQESEIVRQETQIVIHQDSVEELSTRLQEEKQKRATLEAKVEELNENGTKISKLETELALAQDDNEQLKKQLVKLIREKDTLWQRTEKLEYHRKMKGLERWMDDKQVTQCMECLCEFSLTVRKHHCRLCGGIFCARCAKYYVLTSHSKSKSRVCEKCYVVHQHSLEAGSLNTSLIDTPGSAEDVSHGNDHHQRPANDGDDAGTANDGENDHYRSASPNTLTSSGVSGAEGPAGTEATESSSCGPLATEDGDEIPTATTPVVFVVGSQEDKEPSATAASKMAASEPEFEFISEDEVNEARKEPDWKVENEELNTEEQKMEAEGSSRPLSSDQLEREGLTGEEVVVAACDRHAIPVAIHEVGLMLCWEFVSSPKSIGFSVVFQESEGPSAAVEDLVPLCRCSSHQQAVQGELLARKLGIYSLVFDNKFSRFTSKTVKFSLQIKRPEAAY